jgi:CRP-like cAMP-binding protein
MFMKVCCRCSGGLKRRVVVLTKNLSLANQLIANLPPEERAVLLARSELVELELHALVCEAGKNSGYVWFPVEGFVSVMLPVAAAADMAVAQVGREGMFHTSAVFEHEYAAFNCRVQAAGRAFRMTRTVLQQHLQQSRSLREVLSRYAEARLSQLAQQTVCINHHSVAQRLARALLMTRDRLASSELFLTHEVFALMLGVRRESVTLAASALQRRGLISYSRGYVMLLDEGALQSVACSCYAADLQTYERALPAAGVMAVTRSALALASVCEDSPAAVTSRWMKCNLATTSLGSTKG